MTHDREAMPEPTKQVCERCKDDGIPDEPATYIATKPPYWPLCDDHMKLALIAGWEPKSIAEVQVNT